MREIKFRGKRVDNGGWVCGHYFETPLSDEATGSDPKDGWFFLTGRHRHCISKTGCVFEVMPETIGQFTGETEKKYSDGICLRLEPGAIQNNCGRRQDGGEKE